MVMEKKKFSNTGIKPWPPALHKNSIQPWCYA